MINKLLELLQPKDYVSKIKLYCYPHEFKLNRFGSVENIPYLRQIEIKEIKNEQLGSRIKA